MTHYPSSWSILFLLRSVLSASVIPRRVITGERVAKDQRATNDAYAALGNPKVNEKTMQRTVHAGVDKKSHDLRVRDTHIRAGGEPIDGFGRNIHGGYLRGSAPTAAGLIFGQGRRRRRRLRREKSTLIFIRRFNDRREECRLLSPTLFSIRSAHRRLALTF